MDPIHRFGQCNFPIQYTPNTTTDQLVSLPMKRLSNMYRRILLNPVRVTWLTAEKRRRQNWFPLQIECEIGHYCDNYILGEIEFSVGPLWCDFGCKNSSCYCFKIPALIPFTGSPHRKINLDIIGIKEY